MGGTMKEWINNELSTCKLKDKRLEVRLSNILERFSEDPVASIPASCKGWSETQATYRLLNNERLDYKEIIKPHTDSSERRLSGEKVVLMINDTTSLDFTGAKGASDLGYIENKYSSGLFLHPTVAITPKRLNLGVVDLQLWIRCYEDIGKKKLRKQLAFEDKESYTWFKSYKAADKIAQSNPSTQIISIGDRENDIFEIFSEAIKATSKADILIRSCQNRKIASSGLLWEEMENSEIHATIDLHLPKTEKRFARDITMTLQYKRVMLQAPYRKTGKLENIEITALLAREINPPADSEAVEWMLLTTIPIADKETAVKLLGYYSARWEIEVFFKILKSGCEVEKLQLHSKENISKAIAIYLIVAWRIQFLMMLNRTCPEMEASRVFEQAEIEAICVIRNKNIIREKAPNLNEIITLIAIEGGFLARKSDKEPGAMTIWKGLIKLDSYTIMYMKMMK